MSPPAEFAVSVTALTSTTRSRSASKTRPPACRSRLTNKLLPLSNVRTLLPECFNSLSITIEVPLAVTTRTLLVSSAVKIELASESVSISEIARSVSGSINHSPTDPLGASVEIPIPENKTRRPDVSIRPPSPPSGPPCASIDPWALVSEESAKTSLHKTTVPPSPT